MHTAIHAAKPRSAKMPSHSRLSFHMGEAFWRVAGTYETIFDVTLEQVQNAIDVNAKNIMVVLNKKTRHIAVRDDGDGVSRANLDKALLQVCKSGKEQGKLGRFGIGLISPLGKCEHFTFTSCPRDSDEGYSEWTFNSAEIKGQANDPTVPHRLRPDLFFISSKKQAGPKGSTTVMWRSEVNIYRYSTDKQISRITSIDALAEAILERFSAVMRRNKVTVNLKFANEDGSTEVREGIHAKRFTGRSLGEAVIHDQDAGKVMFNMHLTPKTTKGRNGKVIVGESDNDYRFGFNLLSRAANGLLSPEVSTALLSGIFEGEITGENVRLHASRRMFEADDAFAGFCAAIEVWFQKHGAKHLEEASSAHREQRYQELGLESLREIEDMLKDPAFADIRSVLDDFKLGTTGIGHAPRQVAGVQNETSISTQGRVPRVRQEEPESHTPAARDKPKHRPFTVVGPQGQQRALVKRDSFGLQFSHVAMDGSDRLWELDIRQGILHFNVNHPTWVACDVSDRKVRQLQESVAIHALTIRLMPEELEEKMRLAFDEALRPLLHLYQVSPAFNIRKRTAKSDT